MSPEIMAKALSLRYNCIQGNFNMATFMGLGLLVTLDQLYVQVYLLSLAR